MSDHTVAKFNNEELCAWLQERPSRFKNDGDMEAICEAMRVNEIDGETFVDLAEADITGLFPDGSTRVVLRRKQVRNIVSELGTMDVELPLYVTPERVAVPPVEFMLAQTPGITEPEIPAHIFHNIVQDQVAVMVTATKQLTPPRNPTSAELEHVARRLVQRYPTLKTEGEDAKNAHILLLTRMKKRMYNKTPKRTTRGPNKKKESPEEANGLRRSPRKHNQPDPAAEPNPTQQDLHSPQASSSKGAGSSKQVTSKSNPNKRGASGSGPVKEKQVRRELLPPPAQQEGHHETAYTMERHYKLLKEEMDKPKRNYGTVSQLLDLEFPARKEFAANISAATTRPTAVIQRYPCFGEPRHLQDELRRHVATGDKDFLQDLKERLPREAKTLVKFAVKQGVLSSADMTDWTDDKKMRKALQVLPQLFKGKGSPPLPLKDMMIVYLKNKGNVTAEMARDKKRTAFIVEKISSKRSDEPIVYVVVHGKPVAVCGSVVEGFVALIGALYCFYQPHPPSIAPAMVFVEHHMLKDKNVNPLDREALESTTVYKKFKDYVKAAGDSGSDSE